MINKVDYRIIIDPTLKFGSQLQFQYTQKSLSNLKDVYLIAKKMQQSQIVVSIDSSFNQEELKLSQISFKKSLVTLELDLNLYNINEVVFEEEMHCKVNDLSFTDLKPLLVQQANFHSNNYSDYYKNVQSIDWKDYLKVVNEDLNSSFSHNLFLFKNNKVIGLIFGAINSNLLNVFEFVVDEELRGQGIGTKLLEKYINNSKQFGVNKIVLETWWNQPSRRIYEKLGFIVTKQEYYKNVTNTNVV